MSNPNKCARCSKPAGLACPTCKPTSSDLHVQVSYCSFECLAMHKPDHLKDCKKAKAVRALRRAAEIGREVFLKAREALNDCRIVKVEKEGRTIKVYTRSVPGPVVFVEFPKSIVADPELRMAALLMHTDQEAVALMMPLMEQLLHTISGIVITEVNTGLENTPLEVDHFVDEVYIGGGKHSCHTALLVQLVAVTAMSDDDRWTKMLQEMMPGQLLKIGEFSYGGHLQTNEPDSKATDLKVKGKKNQDQFVIDIACDQFGLAPIMPWAAFKQYAPTGCTKSPYGVSDAELQRTAARGGMSIHRNLLNFHAVVYDSLPLNAQSWAQHENIAIEDFLFLPEERFVPAKARLCKKLGEAIECNVGDLYRGQPNRGRSILKKVGDTSEWPGMHTTITRYMKHDFKLCSLSERMAQVEAREAHIKTCPDCSSHI